MAKAGSVVATELDKRARRTSIASAICTAAALVCAFSPIPPEAVPIPIALAVGGLLLAIVARQIGLRSTGRVHGRLSLLSAIVSSVLIFYLVRIGLVLLSLKSN